MIAPPLIISREDLDRGFNALDAALSIADKEVR
jgi:4-aminobutyrate aminotransferase-like enzyme